LNHRTNGAHSGVTGNVQANDLPAIADEILHEEIHLGTQRGRLALFGDQDQLSPRLDDW
jgi:hypothetical protein